ncbi:MAG TPA: Ig-like domain repeat protein [Acidobacteriaceae bacterium]|jgi:hypothetical protein|nr:Ig-like domain repeat protein [Acidobacteriaceae bacterium]
MGHRQRFGGWCYLLLAGLLAVGSNASGAQKFVAGDRASGSSSSSISSVRLERMLLLLQPSAAQQKSLDTLLIAQQTPGNANYRQWLTAAQFADRYGVSAKDAAAVVTWLRGQGFTVAPLPAGRGWIEFSGTVGQVEAAFKPQVQALEFYGAVAPIRRSIASHVIAVAATQSEGQVRYQMQGAATFPASIAPIVKGLVSLDGALSAPATSVPIETGERAEALAAESSLSAAKALTPSLAQNWLQVAALKADGVTGAGESIAIPARSDVRAEDFAAFRKSFGLPEMALSVHAAGADAGRTVDEAAAMLAASWAGVAAPEAQIVLVPAASTNATDGIDLALATTIDGALAHTVSVGYTACESGLSAAHQAFYAALYRQAAAEGIAVIAASGDSGAAACHSPLDANAVSSGWGVNGLASTPWNTAVGAVVFAADSNTNDTALSGWQPANAGDVAYATGGGASSIYATPEWQAASGVPASDPALVRENASAYGAVVAHHRYLPDLSLPAGLSASGVRGLTFCFAGDSGVDGCRVERAGGSAASAAIFAGVAALLAQKYGPQGNLAPNLYALGRREISSNGSRADSSAQSIADIASGGAMLPCIADSPGCEASGQIGFRATAGYDLATGLGSVRADALVRNWASAAAVGTAPVTVEMTNAQGVTYNPSAIITLTAKVLSGSGGSVPTGTVQFHDLTVGANTGSPVTLAADGTASYSENAQFTQGGHNIEAIYSGDSTYEAATSLPIVITTEPSPTTMTVTPSTSTPVGGATITVTGTVTASNPGNAPPSGTITINLDGIAQGSAPLATASGVTSGSVNVTIPSAGAHNVQGTYSGDTNYNQATSSSVAITVAKGGTVTSIAATPSTLTAGVPETFTATLAPATAGTTTYTITGTVSFYDAGATLLGTAAVTSNTAILTGIVLSTTTAHTITAVYSGDTSWGASVSSPLLLSPILLPVTVVLTSSNTVLAPGQSATLTTTVTPVTTPIITAEQHPTGSVFFYAGTTLIGSVALSAGVGDSGVATTFVSQLPAGAYAITAQYAGDATYGLALSNSLSLEVEDFTASCSVNNVTVVQGQTATVNCTVASLGGLTGPIQVVCAEQNAPQTGAIGCTFDPTVVNGSGQTTLTIVTTAGDITQSRMNAGPPLRDDRPTDRHGHPLWPAAGGGVALAFAGLLLSPVGRRARWLRKHVGRMMMFALLLAGLAGAGLGCNSSSFTKGSLGTPLGVHTLKITAAADVSTVTVSHYAYVTVDVTP